MYNNNNNMDDETKLINIGRSEKKKHDKNQTRVGGNIIAWVIDEQTK